MEPDANQAPNLPVATHERRECMFCLEEEFGRKKHLTIWYAKLYPCECRFASHWQCLIKWQVNCADELQCPICKIVSIDPLFEELPLVAVPQEELMPDTSRVYYPVSQEMPTKMRYCMFLYFLFVVWMFFYGYMKIFVT